MAAATAPPPRVGAPSHLQGLSEPSTPVVLLMYPQGSDDDWGVLSRTLGSGKGPPSRLPAGSWPGVSPCWTPTEPFRRPGFAALPSRTFTGQRTLNWMPAGIGDGALPEGP